MTLFVSAVMWKFSKIPQGMSDETEVFLTQNPATHNKIFRLLPETVQDSVTKKLRIGMPFRDWIYQIVLTVAFYVFGMTDRYLLDLVESISVWEEKERERERERKKK